MIDDILKFAYIPGATVISEKEGEYFKTSITFGETIEEDFSGSKLTFYQKEESGPVFSAYYLATFYCRYNSIPSFVYVLEEQLLNELTDLNSLDSLGIMTFREINTYLLDVGNLSNLKSLNISGLLNDNIAGLRNLSKLEELYLGIVKFPREILKLKNLKVLGLQYVDSIPARINELDSLEQLSVMETKIMELPDSICDLHSLKELCIGKNSLIELPKNIGDLEKLEILMIFENKLRKLPESLAKLKNLRQVCMNQNYLTDIPDEIMQLPKLVEFRFSENSLEKSRESEILQSLKERGIRCNF